MEVFEQLKQLIKQKDKQRIVFPEGVDRGGRALFGLGARLGLLNSDKLRMPQIYIRESDCE